MSVKIISMRINALMYFPDIFVIRLSDLDL